MTEKTAPSPYSIEAHDRELVSQLQATFKIGLWATVILTIFYLLGSIGRTPDQEDVITIDNLLASAAIATFGSISFGIANFCLKNNRLNLAAGIFIIALVLVGSCTLFILNTGLYDPVTHLFYLALVIASVFLGKRVIYAVTATGVSFNLIYFILAQNQLVETKYRLPTIDDILLDSVILIITATILTITVQRFLKSRNTLMLYQTDLEGLVSARTIELNEERDKAEAANRAKGQFLANMSHELRTPLNAIIGYSELLQETVEVINADPSGEELTPDLEKIEKAGRHLLQLINDILDLSKVEEGKTVLIKEFYPIREIVDEISHSLKPQILAKGLNFKIDYVNDPFSNELVLIDKLKTQQILINLLVNAIKFTRQGEISLTINRSGHGENLSIQFTVSDSGIGMSPEFIPHLFNRFDQEDNSTTRQYTGTGLGLAICKQFVDIMDGAISVHSEKGVGTRFYVTIPTKLIPKEEAQSQFSPTPPPI